MSEYTAGFKTCDRKRIMVVDDEPMISELFEMILSDAFPGCAIDMAANGAVALQCFQEHHHAVLLMDLHMPVMDGVEAFQRIRSYCGQQAWEMPAVIFCSGYAPGVALTETIEENPLHGFLPKPVSAVDIESAVRERLERAI